MFNKHDLRKNECMLTGSFKRKGYDWWWHNFTAINEKTGEEKPFFIEYFIVNPKLGGDKAIYGQLPENKKKGIRPSYLMIKAGCWGEDLKIQLHRFFAIDDVVVHRRKPYSVEAGDCYASDTLLKGFIHMPKDISEAHPEFMCDYGDIEWELQVDKKVAFNVGYGTSHIFRFLKAFEMYWHAEGMKSLYSGYIKVNGVRYKVVPETSYGYADKNWGRGFTTPWVWLSSCNLTSNLTGKKLNDSVFDIGGGKPKVFGIPLNRKLLSAFWYEGKPYEFNFSKFWTNTRTKFECHESDDEIIWHVEQKTWNNKMVTDIRCLKKDMIKVNYEAPDGSKRHNNLWNGGNGYGNVKLYHRNKLIDDIDCKNVGCEFGEYDK